MQHPQKIRDQADVLQSIKLGDCLRCNTRNRSHDYRAESVADDDETEWNSYSADSRCVPVNRLVLCYSPDFAKWRQWLALATLTLRIASGILKYASVFYNDVATSWTLSS